MPLRVFIRKARGILQTFRIRTSDIKLDTDDYLMNAYLFPVFSLLCRPGHRWQINFQGDTSVKLVIENRLYRIVFALLVS
ncbi:hypothetical protein G8759_22080 [Spirosoma aureum]|uniref:Uncharacterized protein n=1 Tax=Spirosoma aureum TaxID=2692134 RepID=A0A6G9ARV8_9BACT|nr:hypothetical protein [Spirosoma aureum]QIP15118.1 hypothetical protein G8759_22080 [Spirosoma aureum]